MHLTSGLVTKSCARSLLCIASETLEAKVDTGELRWVFDLAKPGAERRYLRFLARELVAPETVVDLDFPAVFASMLPVQHRSRLTTEELVFLLCAARVTVWQFIQTGELTAELEDHRYWISKASLFDFLKRHCLSCA